MVASLWKWVTQSMGSKNKQAGPPPGPLVTFSDAVLGLFLLWTVSSPRDQRAFYVMYNAAVLRSAWWKVGVPCLPVQVSMPGFRSSGSRDRVKNAILHSLRNAVSQECGDLDLEEGGVTITTVHVTSCSHYHSNYWNCCLGGGVAFRWRVGAGTGV